MLSFGSSWSISLENYIVLLIGWKCIECWGNCVQMHLITIIEAIKMRLSAMSPHIRIWIRYIMQIRSDACDRSDIAILSDCNKQANELIGITDRIERERGSERSKQRAYLMNSSKCLGRRTQPRCHDHCQFNFTHIWTAQPFSFALSINLESEKLDAHRSMARCTLRSTVTLAFYSVDHNHHFITNRFFAVGFEFFYVSTTCSTPRITSEI